MSNVASSNHEDGNPIVSQFLAITGHSVDTSVALQYLEMSSNHLETAVSLFMEMDNDDSAGRCKAERGEEEEEEEVRGDEEHLPYSTVVVGGDDEGNDTHHIEDGDESSNNLSEPDYDHLLVEDRGCDDQQSDAFGSDTDDMPSSPDYDHLGLRCDEEEPSPSLFHDDRGFGDNTVTQNEEMHYYPMVHSSNDDKESKSIDDTVRETAENDKYIYSKDENEGDDYILGTLMVRVLQAKNLKSNPNHEGGGVMGLLSNHRRFRHHKSAMSPASGGALTPSSYYANRNEQIYAKLSYLDNGPQFTSISMEQNNGDYHWSRGDQSYFDVTCPAFPLRMGEKMQQQDPPSLSKAEKQTPSPFAAAAAAQKINAQCEKPNNVQRHARSRERYSPPILHLSLYSKKSSSGPKTSHKKQNKRLPYLDNSAKENLSEKSDDYLLGQCSINVLHILSGKTPYFDEWCTLHNNTNNSQQQKNQSRGNDKDVMGRIRTVIEYEPTDPPPRPGDRCVFANAYPLAEELYPVPLHSIRNSVRPIASSTLASTLSSTSVASAAAAAYSKTSPSSSSSLLLTRRPKRYRVEEVVGDHIVLSYRTPVENWTCTFECHRYLLLCVERHQACVEKYAERVLDLCDNVSQSPAMETVVRTVETLPEEGLLYVGAEVVGGGVGLLGRWWEVGVEGLVEDVVDGINLDGRHSHLSDNEEDEDGNMNYSADVNKIEPHQNERKALPGMPCCPITGIAMVEPVVAADGHTYERHAISRWFQTSNRSPLTGEMLAHSELVPNYLLLSSLGNNADAIEQEGGNAHLNNI